MCATRVLVVEDDAAMAAAVSDVLARYGFTSAHAGTLAAARARLPEADLVVLDLGLPDGDGLDLCREIRGRIPVVIVSARDEMTDRVVALETGADDYLLKPFSGRELVARLRAVLRRVEGGTLESGAVHAGDLEIDPERLAVRLRGEDVPLSPKERDLLLALARRRGRPASRQQLVKEVWGLSLAQGRRTLDVHLSSLRKKLGDDPAGPKYVVTVHGAGVRLRVDE